MIPDMPPQMSKRTEVLPRKCKCEVNALLQRGPDEGKHEQDGPMQKLSCKDILSTWAGAALWDPGWPAGEQITDLKGPVEAKKNNDSGGLHVG